MTTHRVSLHTGIASWRKRIVTGLLTLGLAGTSSWGAEPAATGLFPTRTPRYLGEEEFESLSGEWAAWAADAAGEVSKFYLAQDAAARQTALENVKIKLGTLETALADAKYASIRAPLSRLYSRLSRRVRIAEAVIATSQQDLSKHRGAKLDAASAELARRVADVRSMLKGIPSGDAWLPFVHADELQGVAEKKDESRAALDLLAQTQANLANRDSLPAAQKDFLAKPAFRKLEDAVSGMISAIELPSGDAASGGLNQALAKFVSAIEDYEEHRSEASTESIRNAYLLVSQQAADDGKLLTEAMRQSYFNYNLRAFAGEGILQRMYGDSRSESSWINDRVMEARVTGISCTNSTVTVDVVPSGGDARFNLLVQGNVTVNSTAGTHQATIASVGHHTFSAQKQIWTDGHTFGSAPASVQVSANTQITGASTKADWIPIVRRVARNIALNEANSRRGQANSLAADKIRSQVGPRLNKEVASKFDAAPMELETRIYGPLRELGVYPDAMSLSSTDTVIDLRARVMNPDEVGANKPAPGATAYRDEMLLQIHESLLNNAMERVRLHGKTLTETEVQDLLRNRFKKLLGDKFQPPPKKAADPNEPARKEITFVFDEQDPVRFIIEGGFIRLQLQTGMKRVNDEGQEEILEPQQITIPLKFTVVGNDIRMERGTVAVKVIPGRTVENRGRQIVQAGVMRQNIERLFEPQTFKGYVDVGDAKKIRLYTRSIESEGSWTSVRLK